jgi:hypothetical protein
MKYILLCVLAFSLSIHAFDQTWFQENICDEVILKGAKPGFYRINQAHHFKSDGVDYFIQKEGRDFFVKSKLGKIKLKGEIKRVLDFVVIDQSFWVVGETGLVEFNEFGNQIRQYSNFNSARGVYYHPFLDKVYIAAESEGLSVFDFNTKKFDKLLSLSANGFAGPSLAVSVTGDPRGNIYIALSSHVKGSLNGLAVYSPVEENIIRYVQFDPIKAGYVDNYASAYYVDGSVFLNNGGWIHEMNKAQLTQKTVVPKWHSLSHTAGETFQYVQFRGDLIFEQNKVYGCSLIREKVAGEKRPRRYGKVFSMML